MSWLERLKKIEGPLSQGATETAETLSVVFVAPALGTSDKSLPWPAGESAALHAGHNDAGEPPEVQLAPAQGLASDALSWPQGPAMSALEIEAFMARVVLFSDKGLDLKRSEQVAERLLRRDRDRDDRTLCVECRRFRAPWRCSAGGACLPANLQRCDQFADHYARARETATTVLGDQP